MVKLFLCGFLFLLANFCYANEKQFAMGVAGTSITRDTGNVTDDTLVGYNLSFRAYRTLNSARSYIGTGIDVFSVSDLPAIGFRAVDYKYDWSRSLSFNTFLGAVRVNSGAPQVGYYFGLGTNIKTKVNNMRIGAEILYGSGLQRDIVDGDSVDSPVRPDIFLEFANVHFFIAYNF